MTTSNTKIFREWDENVSISWQKDSRIKLNKIIRKYNKWATNHEGDISKNLTMLTKLELELNKVYCNQDGGEAYKDEVSEMHSIVRFKFKQLVYEL